MRLALVLGLESLTPSVNALCYELSGEGERASLLLVVVVVVSE
jgi:hypothetical protein